MANKANKLSKHTSKADLQDKSGSPFSASVFGGVTNAKARSGKIPHPGGYRGKNTPANWRRFNP